MQRTEHAYRGESFAHNIRRLMLNAGTPCSLIAYDPSRDRFVFDSYPTESDRHEALELPI